MDVQFFSNGRLEYESILIIWVFWLASRAVVEGMKWKKQGNQLREYVDSEHKTDFRERTRPAACNRIITGVNEILSHIDVA